MVSLHTNPSHTPKRRRHPALVFNHHDRFERLRASQRYKRMRETTMTRDLKLEGSINPMFARHGEQSEARQYRGREIESRLGDALTGGGQVSNLIAIVKYDPREIISDGQTCGYEETISLKSGSGRWSNWSHAILTIIEYTVGTHDFLLTPCSEATFEHFDPEKPIDHGCLGGVAEALTAYSIEPNDISTAFNVLMHVPVSSYVHLSVEPTISRKSASILLRAEIDLVFGLMARPVFTSNCASFNPVEYIIEQGGVSS